MKITDRKPNYMLFLLISLSFLLLRFLYPLADPGLNLSNSTGIFTDEGFFIMEQRNQILSHGTLLSEFKPLWTNPIFWTWNSLVLRITGLSRLNFRLFNISIYVILTILLWILYPNNKNKFILFIIWSSCYTLFGYGRLGMGDSLGLYFQLLVFVIYLRRKEGKFWYFGLILALIFIYRVLHLPLIMVIMIDLFFRYAKTRKVELLFLVISFLIPVVSWYAYFFLTCNNPQTYIIFYKSHISAGIYDYLQKIYYSYRNPVILQNIIVILLALTGITVNFYRKTWTREELLIGGYIVLELLVFVIVRHKATRYFIVIIPVCAMFVQLMYNKYRKYNKLIFAVISLFFFTQVYLITDYYLNLKYTQVNLDNKFASFPQSEIIAGNPSTGCCFKGTFRCFPVWFDYFNGTEFIEKHKPRYLTIEYDKDDWQRFMKQDELKLKYKIIDRCPLGKIDAIIMERK